MEKLYIGSPGASNMVVIFPSIQYIIDVKIVAMSFSTLYTSVAFVRKTFARNLGSRPSKVPVPVKLVPVAVNVVPALLSEAPIEVKSAVVPVNLILYSSPITKGVLLLNTFPEGTSSSQYLEILYRANRSTSDSLIHSPTPNLSFAIRS